MDQLITSLSKFFYHNTFWRINLQFFRFIKILKHLVQTTLSFISTLNLQQTSSSIEEKGRLNPFSAQVTPFKYEVRRREGWGHWLKHEQIDRRPIETNNTKMIWPLINQSSQYKNTKRHLNWLLERMVYINDHPWLEERNSIIIPHIMHLFLKGT